MAYEGRRPNDQMPILQTILKAVCDKDEIVPLANNMPQFLFLVNCFNANDEIGKTRLGEILRQLKGQDRELFITLVCRLAYIKTIGHNPESVELSNALLQQGHETITSRNTLGLIDSTGNSFSFIDHTLQKILAAVYLCHQPIMTMIDFIKQFILNPKQESVIAKDCGEVLQFIFGLVESKIIESLNYILPHLLHYMCQFVLATEPVIDNTTALLVLACLRQGQNPSLCRKVNHEFFKRQILSYKLDALDLSDLKYYLATTTEKHQNWTIYFNDDSIKPTLVQFANEMKREFSVMVHTRCYPALTRYEKGRVTISNRNPDYLMSVMGQLISRDQSFTALQEGSTSTSITDTSPSGVYGYLTVEQFESMKAYENITYFNMVKDLLMTPLQIYLTLPMQTQYRKGDHIWLVGSQNIIHDFYTNVQISPISAMHWVKVKQPDGTKELEDRYERISLDQLRSLSLDAAGTSEIVLLNSHRFHQIAVTPPTGLEPTIISLYGHSEEAEEPGYIGCDYLVTAHEATGDVRWKGSSQFDVIKDERIGRELPLPLKRRTESGNTVFNNSPPQSSYQIQKYSMSAIRPLGEQPPANEQQLKRIALESFDTPGQCFFGDEIKFVPYHVYIQPNQLPGTRVLREGGNGLILEVFFEGEPYTVKRTAFRWREVLIMPKLRHKNILRLIAMLMGPPIEGYPRRRYVFHYYPRMTNDLGRLIGSYEKYCLRTLQEKYKKETLLMNKIFSNFKYIARELLQGLDYLHTLPNPIVHRDIKPSNILVLTDCDCPNPLACVCRVRPHIVLSDFDASLELNPDGTLHADSLTQGFYQSADRTYHVSPVGTIGFKSPEGYIHMIGNSYDVMPVLSTKADIFSFGLVMLLLVLAEEGPRSMAKIGILLLKLNKKSTSGRSSLSSVTVTDSDVNKILPINRLKKEFHKTNPTLVDFITGTLEIDPLKRFSASDLLKHPYLTNLLPSPSASHLNRHVLPAQTNLAQPCLAPSNLSLSSQSAPPTQSHLLAQHHPLPPAQPRSSPSLCSSLTAQSQPSQPTQLHPSPQAPPKVYSPLQPYKMPKEGGYHGHALIINNINIVGRDERLGAEKDDENLNSTFNTLGYRCRTYRDKSAIEMDHLINDMLKNTDHSQSDSFVLCLLSHGDYETIFGADDKPMLIKDITNKIVSCPALVGKPKFVFIQSCRRNYYDSSMIFLPDESDLFFGYATTPNTQACRFTDIGSWYIIELCRSLTTHYKDLDLLTMVQVAHHEVATKDEYVYEINERTKDGKMIVRKYKQSPQMVSTLIRPVRF